MQTELEIRRLISESPTGDSGLVAYLVGKPAPGVHEPLEEVVVEAGRGFVGDHPRKSFWRGSEIPGREVTAVSIEVLRAMGVAPDIPGDNLVTRGIDLGSLAEGDRLEIGDVILERSAKPHRPCALFRDRTGEAAFRVASDGFRGALFRVIRGGRLRIDDSVTVIRVRQEVTP